MMDFVKSHEQPEGGFSLSVVMPPDLEDTYYAMRIIDIFNDLTGENIKVNDKTLDYVQSIKQTDLKNYALLFRHAWLCKKLGLEYADFEAVPELKNIDDICHYLSLCALLCKKPNLDLKTEKYLSKIGFEKPRFVQQAMMFIHTAKRLGLDFDKEIFKNFLLESQGCDGGFGFLPKTTSFLENTYFALRAVDELDIRPLMPDLCKEFILSCRAKNGGFGRQIGAVPSLEASYFAIRSLIIMDKWEKAAK